MVLRCSKHYNAKGAASCSFLCVWEMFLFVWRPRTQRSSTVPFECLPDPGCYVYHENASKNKQGGLQQLKLEHKVCKIVANAAVKKKCPVHVYTLYS